MDAADAALGGSSGNGRPVGAEASGAQSGQGPGRTEHVAENNTGKSTSAAAAGKPIADYESTTLDPTLKAWMERKTQLRG